MDKNKHLISKYLDGELNPVEVRDFEEAMAQDHELREELDLYRDVNEALSDTEVLDLRAQLNEIHEELTPQIEKITRRSSKRVLRYAVAASLAVIISLGTYSLFFKKVNDSKLVSQFYKPYDVTLVNRSANSELTSILGEALFFYDNSNYQKAVVLFEEILDNHPDMMASQLYLGISNMELKEYTKAGKSFNTVIKQNDNLYIEQAEWYLGMVYVLTDQKEKARKQFRKIKQSEGYYRDEAARILRKLKRK